MNTENDMDLNLYRPLLDAAMNDEWESIGNFIDSHLEVPITACGRTALHIAAGAGNSKFMLKLLERMPTEALELKDAYDGNTALHLAVIGGLEDAVKAMVQKHENLKRMCNGKGLNPLLNAAIHVSFEHTEIIKFLCDEMKDEPSFLQGCSGAHLICSITRADLYELASDLIREYPSLATAREGDGSTLLDVLAEKGSHVKLSYMPLNVIFTLLPSLKAYRRERLSFSTFLPELLDIISEEIACMTRVDMHHFFWGSNFLKTAAENGTIEIVKLCISTYPDQLWFPHEERNILQIAVENRQDSVFDYLYDHMNADEKILITRVVDPNGGNILHIAAKLAPACRLNIYSSIVVQIKSEIRWFKKVEKRVPPAFRKKRNDSGETPQQVFTREHKDLVKKGEAYMIRTAESCLVVAALVATVAFAAIFTVPGGNFSDSGDPIFLGKKSFIGFMVVDAIALLNSTTSILVFLSVLAGSYAEADFEMILPTKLVFGLGSLDVSVISVIVAFNIAFDIILGSRYGWAPFLIAGFTFASVFVYLGLLTNFQRELIGFYRLRN
ncbi:ankyrin repeat-containing protein NPR4-like [Papaver somniferum]|uniref:ankyrin repeat-containing protein NPR4-like n=1 Tax=Papaver somniferum TaxID=3469 RepID=UPI000E6F9E6F|nr:ankyrin repeat-containing protein NPR4-like [Papaver somniferum]